MRRTIALALTMIFSWMLIAPAFGPGADANLPPCCRRNGKHHCMMRMELLSGKRKGFSTVSEKCPCQPASTCAVHSPVFDPNTKQQYGAEVTRQPVRPALSAAFDRICFFRGNPKRGPPSPLA